MEVKIGVQNSAREIVLESTQTTEEITAAVSSAIKADAGLFSLDDEKGRRVLIPVQRLAYVEIGVPEQRRVGFGAS